MTDKTEWRELYYGPWTMTEARDLFFHRVIARSSDIIAQEAGSLWIARSYLSKSMPEAVSAILRTDGKVVTMGMGKAGLVARRLAAMLCAGGTPAVCLHPGDAAHGDLGVISDEDVVVACSTSGQTREVVEALEFALEIGLDTVIAVTSYPEQTVGQKADVVIEMGVYEEAGPLGLLPSCSTAVMSAMCDALALCVMQEKGTTREDFGRRHHGGYLGQVTRGSGGEDG